MATLASVTHMLALAKFRRIRILPTAGIVNVRMEQRVVATDAVASGSLPGEHILLDVHRALGIDHGRKVDALIERKPGEHIQKGDIIAKTGGLIPRVLRSPNDGMILSSKEGSILIEGESVPVEVKAGLPGTVVQVVTERGAVIESTGSLIQGVWGNGQVGLGILLTLAKTPDEEFTRGRLDVSMRGAVVAAGICNDADALQAAMDAPLKGLILASLAPDLIETAKSMPYPIIILEGFGKIPMNTLAFKMFNANEKKDISINATEWNPHTGERPELLMPSGGNAGEILDAINFDVQQTVRLTMPPYAGRLGIIEQIRPGTSVIANGLRVSAAVVRLENSELVTLPLASLDLLG